MKKLKFFVIIWSLLTILKMILLTTVGLYNEYLLFFMGFNTPYYAVFWTVVFCGFGTEVLLARICLIIGLLFMLFWIISIIRIKHSNWFAYLLIVDPCFSLLMFLLPIHTNEFIFSWQFVGLILEIVISMMIMFYIKKRNQPRNLLVEASF